MANDYVHFLELAHDNERHNFHECGIHVHFQRTENERSAHNQVNIPTIAVGAHD